MQLSCTLPRGNACQEPAIGEGFILLIRTLIIRPSPVLWILLLYCYSVRRSKGPTRVFYCLSYLGIVYLVVGC